MNSEEGRDGFAHKRAAYSLEELNEMVPAEFVRALGHVFEDSPWIAERSWAERPFASVEAIHEAFCRTLYAADHYEHLQLIRAHPDLVGQVARDGGLDRDSAEHTAAGLGELSSQEVALLEGYNREYHERFGFPFVICTRENQKTSILEAFPIRLRHEREEEIKLALRELARIAWFRLRDAVSPNPSEIPS